MNRLISKLEQGAAHVMDAPQIAHAVGLGTAGLGAGNYFGWVPDAFLTMSNYAAAGGFALTVVLIWRHITITRIASRDSALREKEAIYREAEHGLTVQRLKYELDEVRGSTNG